MTAEVDPSSEGLDKLREKLDRVDQRLLETIHERLACCVRIAEHKREHDVPMMQPQRIGLVQARVAEFADRHDIDPTFLRRLYELIIAETCRVENLVIDEAD